MRPAEFEEKEYEFPLYRQLQQTDKELWPPGQVLEDYQPVCRSTAASAWEARPMPVHGYSSLADSEMTLNPFV
jgi:hypothetical protein